MKKMLIVDDEHHIVNWLTELFESQQNLDLVIFKAYEGNDALKILETTKIDVILLDIKMPGKNGLEIADVILSRWPGCRIIFLTGYNSFDYVYYANKHKNISFLIKTEDDDVIINAVISAIESIDQEQKQLELSSLILSKEKVVSHLFMQSILRDILNGKIQDSQAYKDTSGYDFPLCLSEPVILLYGKMYPYASESDINHQSDLVLKSIQVMEQILYQKFRYALFNYAANTYIWFLQPADPWQNKNAISPIMYIKESFDDIISFYQKNTSCEIMLLLYHQTVSWKNAHNCLLMLNQFALLNTPLQSGQSCGMIYRETDQYNGHLQKQNSVDHCETLLGEMSMYINTGEYRQFSSLLRQIKFSVPRNTSMHDFSIINIYHRISSMLIGCINQYRLQEPLSLQTALYPLYFIHNFDNWREAFNYLEQLIELISELTNFSQLNQKQQTVLVIKKYIHSHLAEDLNLSVLSDLVNYNSSYVSQIFKSDTGMNLSDYITACRINRGKELLLSTTESIHAIAQKVGFDTSQYFSIVFRKKVGLSPGEFRNSQQKPLS